MTEQVWVSIGSNIQPAAMIRAAARDLRQQFGPLILSPVYQTPATGFQGEDFYNLVAGFDTDCPLTDLRQCLRAIEAQNGRVRTAEKFCARTLDIDVMLYGSLISEADGKPVPSPEILTYAFVLQPLADVIPDQLHPVLGVSYQRLWADFTGDQSQIRQIPFNFERPTTKNRGPMA